MSTERSNRQDVLPHETPTTFIIQPATTPDDLIAVASLFEAYGQSLNIDLSFQAFTAERSNLPGSYASPSGTLLLARQNYTNEAIECIGLRPLDEKGVCEIKRLYVAPQGRGSGLGKALVKQAIVAAKRMGYKFMRLDTLGSMKAAQKLYKSLGFVERNAYYDTPIDGTVFLELNLSCWRCLNEVQRPKLGNFGASRMLTRRTVIMRSNETPNRVSIIPPFSVAYRDSTDG